MEVLLLLAAGSSSYTRAKGETTEWEDLQRKHGNLPPLEVSAPAALPLSACPLPPTFVAMHGPADSVAHAAHSARSGPTWSRVPRP